MGLSIAISNISFILINRYTSTRANEKEAISIVIVVNNKIIAGTVHRNITAVEL